GRRGEAADRVEALHRGDVGEVAVARVGDGLEQEPGDRGRVDGRGGDLGAHDGAPVVRLPGRAGEVGPGEIAVLVVEVRARSGEDPSRAGAVGRAGVDLDADAEVRAGEGLIGGRGQSRRHDVRAFVLVGARALGGGGDADRAFARRGEATCERRGE